MKKAIIEFLPIRNHATNKDAGTFTGVVEWDADMGKAYIQHGNFQNVSDNFDREELKMDEAHDGKPYCLFYN